MAHSNVNKHSSVMTIMYALHRTAFFYMTSLYDNLAIKSSIFVTKNTPQLLHVVMTHTSFVEKFQLLHIVYDLGLRC